MWLLHDFVLHTEKMFSDSQHTEPNLPSNRSFWPLTYVSGNFHIEHILRFAAVKGHRHRSVVFHVYVSTAMLRAPRTGAHFTTVDLATPDADCATPVGGKGQHLDTWTWAHGKKNICIRP